MGFRHPLPLLHIPLGSAMKKCSANPPRWYNGCQYEAKFEHKGKWYCGYHDPLRGKRPTIDTEQWISDTARIICHSPTLSIESILRERLPLLGRGK